MSDKPNWAQELSNRFFAIPTVAQRWARIKSRNMGDTEHVDSAIPFHPLSRRLADCSFAVITTGGVHLAGDEPFDMENPYGDASFREIPNAADPANITITHKYYDHRDADADLNVLFPLDHFRDLTERSVIGGLAPRHYGFMGHIEGPLLRVLTHETAPAVADRLVADAVDCVFLTPA